MQSQAQGPAPREQAQQQKQAQKQQQQLQKQQQKQQKEQEKLQAQQQKDLQKQQQRVQKDAARQQKQGHSVDAMQRTTGSSANNPSLRNSASKSSVAYKLPANGKVKSKDVVKQVNSARTQMSGINRKPLPSGDVSVRPNGSLALHASGGREYSVRQNGTVASFSANGRTASFDRAGRVSNLHTSDMDIHRGMSGQRTIVTHRGDNSVLVSTGPHSGYLQRSIVVNNRTLVQRTVVLNNRVFTQTFVGYNYGGVLLPHFVAPVVFAPTFYGWAYYPWAAPIGFRFGWLGAPWYVGPDPYFVAAPVYPSASLWLTDYLIGETLSIAEQHRAEAIANAANGQDVSDEDSSSTDADDSDTDEIHAQVTTPITPELKAAIADEVRQQLAYDSEASQTTSSIPVERGDLPSVLQKENYVFVVSSDLNVTTADQQQCGLQAGDILQLTAPEMKGSPIIQLRVASSKQMDCPAGAKVSVSLNDLQDMHNNFRAQIETGLGTLHDGQGHNGLPAAPEAAVAAPPRPAITGAASAPDTQISSLLEAQMQQASALEAEVSNSAF